MDDRVFAEQYSVTHQSATLVQRGTPQVHVAQHGIECRVGDQTLGVVVRGKAVAGLALYAFHINDDAVQYVQLVGQTEVFHFHVLVDHLGAVGHVLEGADQIEVVQRAQTYHFRLHLAPLTLGELLVLLQDFLAVLEHLVTEVDGGVHTAPVEDAHAGVGLGLHDFVVGIPTALVAVAVLVHFPAV